MANNNQPAGFIPYGSIIGADINFNTVRCALRAGDANATFAGDLVKLDATQDNAAGIPNVTIVSGTTDAIYGVVVAIEVDGSDINTPYRKASTARTCLVITDPNTMYVVQAPGAVALSKCQQNISYKSGSGNTATGVSGMQIDDTTAATTNTLQFKMVGALQDLNNTPNAAFNKMIVKINKSQLADQTAGV